MEIKTGHEIYLKGEDVKEANSKAGYDDKTTKARKEYENKKWISYDDFNNLLEKFIEKHFNRKK